MARTTIDDVHRILDLLAERGVWAWIAGGWGVDALLGRQTREHGDLDVGIDADLEATALEALAEHGFVITTDWRPVRVALTHGSGAEADVHPMQMRHDGSGLQAGFDGVEYLWPAEEITRGIIGGREVRCVSAEVQVRNHRGYEPRPVDRADMRALADATGVTLPRSLR